MNVKKIVFLLLSLLSAASFAGNYADKGTESTPQNNKESEKHFYIDLGAKAYSFNQPNTTLPLSVGYGDPTAGTPFPTTAGNGYATDGWAFSPAIVLGYQFLTDNTQLQAIFGQQNALELHAAYFRNTGTQDKNYGQPYDVNNFIITGIGEAFFPGSETMSQNSESYDNTYEDIGLYYTGNKLINNMLVNAPYIGVDISKLKQDSSYNFTQYFLSGSEPIYDTPLQGVGSDDLSSYYIGLAFGDKATWLLEKNYAVYGKLGAGVYMLHTKLAATQTPVSNANEIEGFDDESLSTSYNVNTTDNQATFKIQAEFGVSYYLRSNQDSTSPSVTLLAGLDYWNDVAYAENPTQVNQAVKIGYADSLSPYVGLQLHIPL